MSLLLWAKIIATHHEDPTASALFDAAVALLAGAALAENCVFVEAAPKQDLASFVHDASQEVQSAVPEAHRALTLLQGFPLQP